MSRLRAFVNSSLPAANTRVFFFVCLGDVSISIASSEHLNLTEPTIRLRYYAATIIQMSGVYEDSKATGYAVSLPPYLFPTQFDVSQLFLV